MWSKTQVVGHKKLEMTKDKCKLPDRPNYEKINKLLIELHEDFYK